MPTTTRKADSLGISDEKPFTISISNQELDVLKRKLQLAEFPDELLESGWNYGVPLNEVRRLIDYWANNYDWRKHEAALNAELPQFTRDIEVDGHGLFNVHYVHKKSKIVDAIPLLFVHGWPGSFLEVRKILPLLVEASPEHPSFHVVAIGLPGFGFSSAPTKPGFALAQYAELANKLMTALGYHQYVTQGGDWGTVITQKIAELYGVKHSRAYHTNAAFADFPHPIYQPYLFIKHLLNWYTPSDKEGNEQTERFWKEGSGYAAIQSTRPQTLGYSLADSPVGLLAWIYDKLRSWSDGYQWTDDEILTWISIYRFSRAGPAASLRIYYEVPLTDHPLLKRPPRLDIPLGFSYFPKELVRFPRAWTQRAGNVVFENQHDVGGHFAAYEQPKALVADLWKMFGRNGPCYGVVPGKTGYA